MNGQGWTGVKIKFCLPKTRKIRKGIIIGTYFKKGDNRQRYIVEMKSGTRLDIYKEEFTILGGF